jgi:hypothetical protein
MSNSTSEIADRLRTKYGAEPYSYLIHMPGEPPTRSADEIKLYMTLDTHCFHVTIANPDRDIDLLIYGWNDILAFARKEHPAKFRDNDRDTTKDILRDLLVTPTIMASGLVWMIFGPTNPLAEIVRIRRPKEAGYEITQRGPSFYNWRQMVA